MADFNSYTFATTPCAHRLPCGYCPLLNRVCPMQGITLDQPYMVGDFINKTEITCEAKVNKDG